MVYTKTTILYAIVIAIFLSPYVVFTWEIGDIDQAIIIIAVYTVLAILTIFVSFRSNRKPHSDTPK